LVLSAENDTCCSWPEYEKEFPCFSGQTVRPGCHPRKLLQNKPTEKAIVLVHGLTDSPFYMKAIGEYFYKSLGYNVYMPLLQCHGLRYPEGMTGVSLLQWKKNLRFAIRAAAENADRVSIGGLSTGGELSIYCGGTDPEVSGDIYLFSPALGLYGGPWGILGGIVELLLRSRFVRFLDNGKPLAGSHPYRYDRVPVNSATELSRLIQEVDGLLKFPQGTIDTIGTIHKKRIFAAWSECDRVINVRKLSKLQAVIRENKFVPFIIPKARQVDHACVVLNEPIYAIDSRPGEAPLEEANPSFTEMMVALRIFESAA
jgi:esterase/lipase